MASSENKRELILTRSPGRLMVSLSLPAIVGMVVIGLYTFVDAIYAGQLSALTRWVRCPSHTRSRSSTRGWRP